MALLLYLGMNKKPPKWRFVGSFERFRYACGVTAGSKIRLRLRLIIRDHEGNPTGQIFEIGDVWEVLEGSSSDPGVIYLRDSTGEVCTWDDNQGFWEWFELLTTDAIQH